MITMKMINFESIKIYNENAVYKVNISGHFLKKKKNK